MLTITEIIIKTNDSMLESTELCKDKEPSNRKIETCRKLSSIVVQNHMF